MLLEVAVVVVAVVQEAEALEFFAWLTLQRCQPLLLLQLVVAAHLVGAAVELPPWVRLSQLLAVQVAAALALLLAAGAEA
jgi:hypothetical protein